MLFSSLLFIRIWVLSTFTCRWILLILVFCLANIGMRWVPKYWLDSILALPLINWLSITEILLRMSSIRWLRIIVCVVFSFVMGVGLSLFKHIYFCSANQDGYAPFHSVRAEEPPSTSGNSSRELEVYHAMLSSFYQNLDKSRITKFDFYYPVWVLGCWWSSRIWIPSLSIISCGRLLTLNCWRMWTLSLCCCCVCRTLLIKKGCFLWDCYVIYVPYSRCALLYDLCFSLSMILYWRIHFEEWGFVDDKHDTQGWMGSTSWNVSVFLLSIHFHDFPLFFSDKMEKITKRFSSIPHSHNHRNLTIFSSNLHFPVIFQSSVS